MKRRNVLAPVSQAKIKPHSHVGSLLLISGVLKSLDTDYCLDAGPTFSWLECTLEDKIPE
ncbi:MAG: hypothetical protein D3909_02145 [Candidatus Electrothrix sp. ATG1]|nr:hypothetical protein [Candidatus Electrothrix sp. ATG1]